MTKVRKKIGTIPINDIEQQVQQSTQAAVTQMQQDVTDFINEETAQYPEIGGAFKFQEDPEGRTEITTDSEGKILSYRDGDGVVHENMGIVSKKTETESLVLTGNALGELKDELNNIIHYKRPNIPLYGTANIKSETFYLTKGDWSSYADDVVLIQVYDDTDANATNRLTLSYFYIKSTLDELPGGGYDRTSINANSVRLDFYPAGKVAKVDDKYYVLASLNEGQVVPGTSIEVVQCTDVPPYKAWEVSKKPEHYCIVDVDFGEFYSATDIKMGVKYQGSSTTAYRKRNFRFTFYKSGAKPYYPVDSDKFGKKDKIKFGDMLRLSGYNLKANWTDYSRVKELILYPTLLSVWLQRPESNRFPWDSEFSKYSAATGFIQGFPIKLYIAGEFYGMMVFGLKKDERNYILDGDDDGSGIFVSGSATEPDCWSNPDISTWEDEMMDDMSQETINALTEWFDFINDRLIDENQNPIPFDIKNIPLRMDVQGFIDYFICLQVFMMWDNTCRNMILHTRSDKKKFYPFFYDLDLSLGNTIDCDILEYSHTISRDVSFWETIRDTFWDEIVCRYNDLRKTVLNENYINQIYHAYVDVIPSNDYTSENERWGSSTSKEAITNTLSIIKSRLEWLDDNYFKY